MIGLFSFIGLVSFCFGTLSASRSLHADMLRQMLHCPMSFYDTTPIGRIVNRFSKDIDIVDNALPAVLRIAFFNLLTVFCSCTDHLLSSTVIVN